jgi:response regulator RpfG family c-di-GMP phosphodiesterase
MDTAKTIATAHARIDTEATAHKSLTPGQLLLRALVDCGVILMEEWQAMDDLVRHRLLGAATRDELLPLLVEAESLTDYQAARILAGGIEQLVFGNYRILDRIGVGGMGVVYRGEHMLMRRPVAIKVLQLPPDDDEILLKRFFSEMRVLARMRHPNIVGALDAGKRLPSANETYHVHYLVMEHVSGTSLEDMVSPEPLSISRACELAYQIAGALEETHRRQLIHRDIKPSNILVTPDNVAKLLDFGLALHFGRRRLTNPGTLLGTLSYMAPEQAADSAKVDIRADIFALGATLFFCLTGKPPFTAQGNLTQQIAMRLTQPCPELRKYRNDIPLELENVVLRMMAHQREDRYPTPQSVMRALLPFVTPSCHFGSPRRKNDAHLAMTQVAGQPALTPMVPRILIVDDEEHVRGLCKSMLGDDFECHEATNGAEGIQKCAERPFDLLLVDMDMPRLSGAQTLRHLRSQPPCPNLKIIMMSGGVSPDEMSELLALGANDYLSKPLSRQQLLGRVKAALLHKATQDRSEILNQQLLRLNAELEQTLSIRHSDLIHARNALVFALAKIVESRSQETTAHLTRMSRYVVALAQSASQIPRFAMLLNPAYLQTLESSTLLHDIGNVAMPDHILRRTGQLETEDLIILQAHTTIGAETLQSVAKRDHGAAPFWQMAIDIARHHHENFDGSGYPDHLAGNEIPPAARLVAVADAYETMRTAGPLGIPLSHNASVELILKGSRGRFDPFLLQAFQQCETEFEKIFRSCPDGEHAFPSPPCTVENPALVSTGNPY